MRGFGELRRRRLNVGELELGMFVAEVDRPWEDTPFLFQGFPLLTVEDIEAVRQVCRYVYIDETRRVAVAGARLGSAAKGPTDIDPDNPGRGSFAREIGETRAIHAQGSGLIKDMFLDIQLGRGINTAACRELIRRCVYSLLRNDSALLWLTRVKQADDYTGQHCLSVAILAMGFARFLGHGESEIEAIGLCGLLHDVGKIKLDQAILNKPGRLSDEEFDHIKQHANLGYELLLAQRDIPPSTVDVAHAHHERLDGQGYPRGLDASQIPYLARLVGICDCYDAITSHRCYDRARPPKDAFKVLMTGRDSQFDARLVMKFIEWQGVFPVGTLVELHTGEVAIVLETDPKQRLRPRVVVVLDSQKQRCRPRYFDLAKLTVDADGQAYRIKDSLADGSFDIGLADPEIQALLDADAIGALDSVA